MDKSLPEPPSDCFVVSEDLSFEDALLYTSHLLNSASATALDCRDTMQHHDRAKIQAVWHLLDMAKAMVDRSIECLHPRKT